MPLHLWERERERRERERDSLFTFSLYLSEGLWPPRLWPSTATRRGRGWGSWSRGWAPPCLWRRPAREGARSSTRKTSRNVRADQTPTGLSPSLKSMSVGYLGNMCQQQICVIGLSSLESFFRALLKIDLMVMYHSRLLEIISYNLKLGYFWDL